MPALPPVVHLDPTSLATQLADDVRAGLGASPKRLAPKYLYDARGSELFDEITRQPEYYPTDAERALLAAHADEVADASGARTLVELGSGTSEKTRLLLDALTRAGPSSGSSPSTSTRPCSRTPRPRWPRSCPTSRSLRSWGTSSGTCASCRAHPARLVAFLGSTLGNLEPPARAALLADLAATTGPGDSLLLGVDWSRTSTGCSRRTTTRRA